MNTRRLVAGCSSFLLLACLASPSHAAKYRIHWLLGHSNLDYFEEAAQSFKHAVETGSRGEIQVDIITASDKSQEGSELRAGPEIAEAVSRGEAEMGHSFVDVMGSLDHRLWAFEAPFLFRDYRHMEGVFEG